MTPALIAALCGAGGALLIAVIEAAAKFSTNRASATKIVTDSKNVEADTAEVFTRLAAEWTKRADERAVNAEARYGKRLDDLVAVVDRVVMAVDRVAPFLERMAEQATPEEMADVIELRAASRNARRAAG